MYTKEKNKGLLNVTFTTVASFKFSLNIGGSLATPYMIHITFNSFDATLFNSFGYRAWKGNRAQKLAFVEDDHNVASKCDFPIEVDIICSQCITKQYSMCIEHAITSYVLFVTDIIVQGFSLFSSVILFIFHGTIAAQNLPPCVRLCVYKELWNFVTQTNTWTSNFYNETTQGYSARDWVHGFDCQFIKLKVVYCQAKWRESPHGPHRKQGVQRDPTRRPHYPWGLQRFPAGCPRHPHYPYRQKRL